MSDLCMFLDLFLHCNVVTLQEVFSGHKGGKWSMNESVTQVSGFHGQNPWGLLHSSENIVASAFEPNRRLQTEPS